MTSRLVPWAVLALLALASGPGPAADPSVRVGNPWLADAPAAARVRAGYLSLENVSGREQVLVGAESPLFARVEIHRSEVRDGVVRMSPVPRLVLAAGQSAVFEPGGYHLMLLDPREALGAGASVPITLVWADGQRTDLVAQVRSVRPGAPGHHH